MCLGLTGPISGERSHLQAPRGAYFEHLSNTDPFPEVPGVLRRLHLERSALSENATASINSVNSENACVCLRMSEGCLQGNKQQGRGILPECVGGIQSFETSSHASTGLCSHPALGTACTPVSSSCSHTRSPPSCSGPSRRGEAVCHVPPKARSSVDALAHALWLEVRALTNPRLTSQRRLGQRRQP